MSDYMKNQGLVDGITGARNRQRRLEEEIEQLRAELERIAKYRSKEYKTNEQGHFCMFRSAFEGCRDIAKEALKEETRRGKLPSFDTIDDLMADLNADD